MKIYTKTGDGGVTGLYDGTRVQKAEQIFDVLGSLDELGSHIGLFLANFPANFPGEEEKFLVNIQRTLLNIGSIIATPSGNKDLPNITEQNIEEIEHEIDRIDIFLKPLTVFLIMAGESILSAQAHVCRTVCRRVERELEKYGNVDRLITRYINRLSDYFFTLARYHDPAQLKSPV